MFSLPHTHSVYVQDSCTNTHTRSLFLSLAFSLAHTCTHIRTYALPLAHIDLLPRSTSDRETRLKRLTTNTHYISLVHTLSIPLCHTRTHTDLLPCPTPDGETHLKRLKVNTMPVWVNVMFLFGLMIFFRILGYYALVKRANKLVIEHMFLCVYIRIYKHVCVCV